MFAFAFFVANLRGSGVWTPFVEGLRSLSVGDLEDPHVDGLIDAIAIRTGFYSRDLNDVRPVAHTHWRIVTARHGEDRWGQFLIWSCGKTLEVSPLWVKPETRLLTGEASFIRGRLIQVGDIWGGGSTEWPGIRIFQPHGDGWRMAWSYEAPDESGWVEAAPKDPAEVRFRQRFGEMDESRIHFVIRREPPPFEQSHMGEWLRYDVYGVAAGAGYRIGKPIRRDCALAFITDLVRWAQEGETPSFDAAVPTQYRTSLHKRLRSIRGATVSTSVGTVTFSNPNFVLNVAKRADGWHVIAMR